MGGRVRLHALVVGLVVALIAPACGAEDGADQVLAASDAPRLTGDVSAVPAVADAATGFAVDLYTELAANPGNLVFSPHSVAIALTMTRAGAAGVTATEMDRVLHLQDVAEPHTGFNVLDQELATRSGTFTRSDGTQAEVTLRVANALWGQRETVFETTFLDLLAENYGAGMRLVDYIGDVELARQEINAWIADQTEDRIEELIPAGGLNPLTRLVLTNAVYLLAPWESPFEETATAAGPFFLLDGRETTADLMQLVLGLDYASGEGWQAVELPYAGRELAMLVVVPDRGSFDEVESALSPAMLAGIVESLEPVRVDLRFPKFEIRTQAGLTPALRSLGLIDGFDPDRADFSGMTLEERLFIAEVVHEAFIAVDEEGTEAAAATAVVMAATSAPAEPVALTVDRPFLFALRDTSTGTILFLGRLTDPGA